MNVGHTMLTILIIEYWLLTITKYIPTFPVDKSRRFLSASYEIIRNWRPAGIIGRGGVGWRWWWDGVLKQRPPMFRGSQYRVRQRQYWPVGRGSLAEGSNNIRQHNRHQHNKYSSKAEIIVRLEQLCWYQSVLVQSYQGGVMTDLTETETNTQ